MPKVQHRIAWLGLLYGLSSCVMPALDSSKTLTQYAHRIWGQEEGLFQPTVYAIQQSRDGFLWLGTQDSLIRFDGVRFREFESAGATPLHGALVRSLLEDRSGNLWAGTIGNGLIRISAGQEPRRLIAPLVLPSNNIVCLDQGRDGAVWVCTDQGMVRVDGQTGKVTATHNFAGGVRASCEVQGTRWVAGPAVGLRPLNSEARLPEGVEQMARRPVNAMQCGRDGTLWVGTANGLMVVRGGRVTSMTTSSGLPDNAVNSLAESSDGSVWIGTDEGISRWHNGDLSVYRTRDGLSHSVVLSLSFDREGTLWAGTKDGLDQFTDPKLTPYTTSEGLSSNEAGPVLEDRAGRLWIGTLDKGLNVFDGKQFKTITRKDGLTSDEIVSLALGHGDDLWVGTRDGLNHLVDGRVTSKSLRGQVVQTVLAAPGGTLLAGTNQGLMRMSARGELRAHAKSEAVLAAGMGMGQEVLASTADGQLSQGSEQALQFHPLSGIWRPVDCYYVNRKRSSVWLGTLGSGLVRLQGDRVARVHVKDGLWDNRIYAMLEDGRENVWFASSKGIFRVAAQQLEDFADGQVHAVESIPFTTGQLRFECRSGVQPAAWRSHDGRLWFATTSGVVVVDPEHLKGNLPAPPTAITAVLVNGARRELNSELQLRPFEKNVEIHYAGLSFVSPERVTFRYMLDGYDKNWTDAGTRHEAFFTNLPPRTFRFRVQARSADGVWSEGAAGLAFTVKPWFYQRGWFVACLAAGCGLLSFAWYQRRMRAIRRSFDMVLAERSRIARELHDTLLQGISGVTMQLQALWMKMPASSEKKMLREIIEDAGQCSTEARRSVWGLRAPDPRGAAFDEKLAQLCRDSLVHTPLQLELKVAQVELGGNPEAEHQLLRIAKEALGNVVKHADATKVRVTLRRHERRLEMTIADDGKGFDAARDYAGSGHFGVRGMRERMEILGGRLSIESDGHGTRVTVMTGVGADALKTKRLLEPSTDL